MIKVELLLMNQSGLKGITGLSNDVDQNKYESEPDSESINQNPSLEKMSIIKMKPTSFKSKPDTDICLICQDTFMDGHRITMCEQCKIYLHYHCQVEWLYYYNTVLNRNCCHCNQKWKADYSTIQIVKEENKSTVDQLL